MDTLQEEIIVVVGITVTLLIVAVGIISLSLIYKNKQLQYLQEKVNMENAFQQILLETRLEIQEETFKAISQEIHDNIGQSLSFVKINLSTLDPSDRKSAEEKITESKELISKTIHDLRDIARSLHPDFINEIGLSEAIRQQAQLLEKTGRYEIEFNITGNAYKNNQQQELVIFRVVQELLNNVVKHAEASCIVIRLTYEPEKLMITIADDGKGFDTEAFHSQARKNGLGLGNMYDRVALIKGSFLINSKPGEGTFAVLEIPRQTDI